MKPKLLLTITILLSLGVSGCDGGRENPPDVFVSFIHAAPSQGPIAFRREEAIEASLDYKQSVTRTFDIDVYNFHFDISIAGAAAERLVSFTHELVAGTNYAIVATEVGGQLQQLILEAPSTEPDSTNAQVALLHVAPTLGAVDVFLEAPGADLSLVLPLGTISFGEDLAPRTIDAGDYEFTLIQVASPSAVLLRSVTFPLSADQSALFAIIDGAEQGIAPVAIVVTGSTNFSFVDRDLLSQIRVINTISDRSSLDVGIDNDFSLFPGLTFGTISGYADIAPGTHDLTASPVGNPGVLEVDFPFAVEAGRFGTFFIANDPGATSTSFSIDDYRPIVGEITVNLYNAAQLFQFVDVFIAPAGTDLNTIFPTASLLPGGSLPGLAIVPGDFELTIRDGGTVTVLAGPTPMTLIEGGFYGFLITDPAVGSATVDLTLFDDFP